MIDRILAIALNTFREAVRDRVLHAVVLVASAVIVGTLAMAQLSLDQEVRVVHDLGLVAISLFSVIVSVFLGSSLMFKEMERKTLYVILPKPIHRWEFLLGKFFGVLATGCVFIALIGSVFLVVLSVQSGGSWMVPLVGAPVAFAVAALVALRLDDRTAALAPFSLALLGCAAAFAVTTGVEVGALFGGLGLCAFEVALVTSVALFFSSFSTPFVTGLLTIGVWLVGRSADTLQTIESSMLAPEVRSLLHGIARVVPNFVLFVPGERALDASDVWPYVLGSGAYGAAYCAVLLALAGALFQRRDLP